MSVIAFGSINMDIVARVPHIARPGETVMGSRIDRFPGGKGANQAVAAARMQARTLLVSAVGNDDYGRYLLDYLNQSNVDVSNVARIPDSATGQAFISVAESGENAIVVISGANSAVSAPDLSSFQLAGSNVFLAQSELSLEVTEEFLRDAGKHGGPVIWNAAPGDANRREHLKLVDIVILNETELATYAGATSIPDSSEELIRVARALLAKEGQHIVITRGARGALAVSDAAHHEVEGRKVPVVDTTGAGDCFCGALAAALHEGRSLVEAIGFANAAAAISVGRPGATCSIPMRAEVDAVVERRAPRSAR